MRVTAYLSLPPTAGTTDVSWSLGDDIVSTSTLLEWSGLEQEGVWSVTHLIDKSSGDLLVLEPGSLWWSNSSVDLWWPNGAGAQHLYDLTVTINPDGDTVTKKVAFRWNLSNSLFGFLSTFVGLWNLFKSRWQLTWMWRRQSKHQNIGPWKVFEQRNWKIWIFCCRVSRSSSR